MGVGLGIASLALSGYGAYTSKVQGDRALELGEEDAKFQKRMQAQQKATALVDAGKASGQNIVADINEKQERAATTAKIESRKTRKGKKSLLTGSESGSLQTII